MNTKLIQSASSLFLGLIALVCTFLPEEVLNTFSIPENEYITLLLQMAGALYFGFAVLNWMAKTILIGGIYGKALYIGNFVHFLIGALALLKWNIKNQFPSPILTILAVGYAIFSILYALHLFKSPKILKK